MKRHDVVVIGGGPGGSVLASYLAQAGVDVAVVEREPFPRFHIGESLLPFSMDIFREIGVFDRLDDGRYLRKFGAQFLNSEEDGVVRFDFAHGLDDAHGMAFEVPRAEFDRDLLDHARSLGATLYQPESVVGVAVGEGAATVTTDARVIEAKYVADATGRDAFFGKTTKTRFPNLDLNNVGVFTHFENVKPLPGDTEGDIVIGMLPQQRWCWVIPFKGPRTSVGVVCPSQVLRELKSEGDRDAYLRESLDACPAIRRRIADARRVADIGMISNYSHYCESLVDKRTILVGDAASFLDPIFSSGVHLAVSMAREASVVLRDALAKDAPLTDGGGKGRYERFVRTGTHRFHRFIRMFYDTSFVRDMKKTHGLKNVRMAFTSVVAGDVWNEENPLFRTGVLS